MLTLSAAALLLGFIRPTDSFWVSRAARFGNVLLKQKAF